MATTERREDMTTTDTLTEALGGAETREATMRVVPIQSASSERLVNYIERLEVLAEKKDSIASDMTEVFAEAKLEGYDPKVMRMLLKLRKMDDREDFVARLNLYAHQVGMVEQLRLDFDQPSQREVA